MSANRYEGEGANLVLHELDYRLISNRLDFLRLVDLLRVNVLVRVTYYNT